MMNEMFNMNMNANMSKEKICEAKVYNTKTLPECPSENMHKCRMSDSLVAKVPVLIAETKIQIDVESEIKLDEPALEIKRIKKNLYLTQCKLLNTSDCRKGKLFINGFVRKNIEYATIAENTPYNCGLYGNIRHTTVKIPFECVTMVDFITSPEFFEDGFTKELELFSDRFVGCGPCEEELIGRDPCEQEFRHFESFSEKVFCELVDAKIIEADIRMNPVMLMNHMPSEQLFECFEEKMIIYLRLKLLQNQQIKVRKADCGCERREHRRGSRMRRFDG